MTRLVLGPVPCQGCRRLVEWRSDGRWHEGPEVHRCDSIGLRSPGIVVRMVRVVQRFRDLARA